MFREVKIVACVNGFIVQVGCQTVVFTSLNDLLSGIHSYYVDPAGMERQYLSTAHAQHVYGGGVSGQPREALNAAMSTTRIPNGMQAGNAEVYPNITGGSDPGRLIREAELRHVGEVRKDPIGR